MPDRNQGMRGLVGLRERFRLLRKRFWRRSYGQYGEDMVLGAIFEHRSPGTYVDVGSFHPRQFSNTRRLYECGWRGVNIDISPRKIALFDCDRPHDHNVCCAASDHSGALTAYVFDKGSALDTTDPDVAERWAKAFGKPYRECEVACRRLSDILNECGISHIDYLNIDVEGAEMNVLTGVDFAVHRPECISVEIHGELEQASKSDVYRFLIDKRYRLHSWVRPTFIFTTSRQSHDSRLAEPR